MPAKRGVLEKLKRDELQAAVDRFELAPRSCRASKPGSRRRSVSSPA
jgi:hypothetical protein